MNKLREDQIDNESLTDIWKKAEETDTYVSHEISIEHPSMGLAPLTQ